MSDPREPATGVLVLDKPGGFTSHDCVARLRRLFGQRQVGHGGTLDPAATGVLVLCLGRATRLLEYVGGDDKAYVGEVVFGIETDSHDADGEVTATRPAAEVTRGAVAEALYPLRGEILQRPPMVSAKKVGGQRLHKLHRRGVTVEVEPVPVTVHRLELLDFSPGEHPVATVEAVVSAGTYIRALARDLGRALGVGAHLRSLRRTRSGRFDLDAAATLEALDALPPEERPARLLPPLAAVAHLPRATVLPDAVIKLRHGKLLEPSDLDGEPPAADGPVALVDGDEELLAVGEATADGVKPRKVFA